MKRTDLAAIILIAGLSVAVAYFVADAIIGKPSTQSTKVQTAQSISSDIQQPDPAIFNKNAINPTVDVEIGSQ
jgi:hypothetical protein